VTTDPLWCPDCHRRVTSAHPLSMVCLACDRVLCQSCARAHPGAAVRPDQPTAVATQP